MNLLTASVFSDRLIPYLSGAVVQQVKCGPGTGSIFTLQLTQAEATYHLMVFCSWKLLLDGLITCSWKDPETTIAAVLSGIKDLRLRHLHVHPGGDGVLELDAGMLLCLFSDSAIPEDPALESDYFVEVGNTVFTCLRGQFYVEQVKS